MVWLSCRGMWFANTFTIHICEWCIPALSIGELDVERFWRVASVSSEAPHVCDIPYVEYIEHTRRRYSMHTDQHQRCLLDSFSANGIIVRSKSLLWHHSPFVSFAHLLQKASQLRRRCYTPFKASPIQRWVHPPSAPRRNSMHRIMCTEIDLWSAPCIMHHHFKCRYQGMRISFHVTHSSFTNGLNSLRANLWIC